MAVTKSDFGAKLPLERTLERDTSAPAPNPVPHWHVQRPAWADEGPPEKVMTTVWPSLAWANDYTHKLTPRWKEAFHISRPFKVSFDARANGDDWVVMIAGPLRLTAKVSKCSKPNCYLGKGVQD
jgi:hypothetical protein